MVATVGSSEVSASEAAGVSSASASGEAVVATVGSSEVSASEAAGVSSASASASVSGVATVAAVGSSEVAAGVFFSSVLPPKPRIGIPKRGLRD